MKSVAVLQRVERKRETLHKIKLINVYWIGYNLVCRSAVNYWESHQTDFHEILYSCIFRKSVKKIQFSLNSEINNGYLTWRHRYVYNNISGHAAGGAVS